MARDGSLRLPSHHGGRPLGTTCVWKTPTQEANWGLQQRLLSGFSVSEAPGGSAPQAARRGSSLSFIC